MHTRRLPTSLLLSAALLFLVVAGGCKDDEITTLVGEVGVQVSGTLTNNLTPSNGLYLMGIFPAGVQAGPTGALGGAQVSGGSVVNFSIQVQPNAGNAYIFAFEDIDISGDPAFLAEPIGCSTVFTVGTQSVTGITFTIDIIDPPQNCPGTFGPPA